MQPAFALSEQSHQGPNSRLCMLLSSACSRSLGVRGPGRSARWPVMHVPPRVEGRLPNLHKPTLWPTPSVRGRRLLRRSWTERGLDLAAVLCGPRHFFCRGQGLRLNPGERHNLALDSPFLSAPLRPSVTPIFLSLHLAPSSPHLCTLSISSLLLLVLASDCPLSASFSTLAVECPRGSTRLQINSSPWPLTPLHSTSISHPSRRVALHHLLASESCQL